MLLKERKEPTELVVMRQLDVRMELPTKEKYQLSNLEKGYEGEVIFDNKTESLAKDRFIIDDLRLQVNNSFFQIDKLMISKGLIHLFDVKNFEGDYLLESGNLFSAVNGREYKNPVIQLKRSETLFRQLLQSLKLNYLVQASIIYINPEFTLYNAPKDNQIILPTQVNRFLKELNNTQATMDDNHRTLAQKLLSLHQEKNPFSIVPDYDYGKLEKGIHCRDCGSFNTKIIHQYLVCGKCGSFQRVDLSITQHIEEFKLLFPELKITTQIIYEWCNGRINKKRITRVLKNSCKIRGTTSNTYYE